MNGYSSNIPIDYQKIKDILSSIKSENKLEKKCEEFFEWMSWDILKKNEILIKPDKIEKKKQTDYAINLIPIHEEQIKKNLPSKSNNIVEKLKDLNEITFKNSFNRRNSPKKLFHPLSTLTEETKEPFNNFNSLQEIPLVDVKPQNLNSFTMYTEELMDTGDISPEKLSNKVKKMEKLHDFK